MNRKIIFALIIALILITIIFVQKPVEEIKQETEQLAIEVMVENLDTPWAIDFLPDGRMVFTERPGRVNIFDGEVKVIAEIEVSEVSESGLMGIAVDPDFQENKFIYIYYTHSEGNRVSRFELNANLENEVILMDKIPSAKFHDGGRIKFGPDKKLYITTGDATEPPTAQDINSISGKILRMNRDGTIPEDNPFGNYVYSYGHRNSQGIDWHPITGELYSSEHGPTRNDEINIIVKGENYGWPNVQCDEISTSYVNPIRCYSEFTLAPAGIAFHGNDLYIAGLRSAQLRKITFAEDHITIIREEEVFSDLGRIREVVTHDGYLYFATSNRDGRGVPRSNDDKIIRLKMVETFINSQALSDNMKLTSSAFENNGNIPEKYTCEGEEVSPPLEISEVPEGAKSLVLLMDDPDVPKNLRPDGMWDHWVVWNMPADTTSIAEGSNPSGVLGKNSAGSTAYQGPCPPDAEHRYFFKLYALDTELDLPEGSSKADVESAMEGHILEQAELMGKYNKKENR